METTIPLPKPKIVDRWLDRVFGFDWFISYAHEDGRIYAHQLESQLRKNGYTCFIDHRELPVGEALDKNIRRAIHKASALIVIGSPAALHSAWVLKEVTTFSERNRPICPIDIGKCLDAAPADHPLQQAIGDAITLFEPANVLNLGPSENIVPQLNEAFKFRREVRKRLSYLVSAVVLLISLVLLASIFAIVSEIRRQDAVIAQNEASARQLAAESSNEIYSNPQLATLLAVKAVQATRDAGQPVEPQAEEALRFALENIDGKPLARLGNNVTALDLDKSERQLIVGTSTANIHLIDLEEITVHSQSWDAPNNSIVWVSWDRNGETIYSGALDGTFYRHLSDGTTKVLWQGKGFQQEVLTAVGFDATRNLLAYGTHDGYLYLVNLNQPQIIPEQIGELGAQISTLAFSSDGHWLAVGAELLPPLVWQLQELQHGPQLLAVDEVQRITALSFHEAGNYLVGGDASGRLYGWQRTPDNVWRQGAVMDVHIGPVESVRWNPGSYNLVTAGIDGVVYSLQPSDMLDHLSIVREMRGHEASIVGVRFIRKGQQLLSLSMDGELRLWDPWNQNSTHKSLLADIGKNPSTLLSAESSQWVYASSLDTLSQLIMLDDYDIIMLPPSIASATTQSGDMLVSIGAEGRLLYVIEGFNDGEASVTRTLPLDALESPQLVALHNEGTFAAIGDRAGNVLVLNLRDETQQISKEHSTPINNLAFTPDGRLLISVGFNDVVAFWRVDLPSEIQRVPAQSVHESIIWPLAIGPDGRTVVTGDNDGTVVVWNATSNSLPIEGEALENDLSAVYRLAISPDGRWLAAGGIEQEIHLWSIDETGQIGGLVHLIHNGGGITNLEFADDSCTLFSGGASLSIQYWSLCPLPQPTNSHELRGTSSPTYMVYLPGKKSIVDIDYRGVLNLWDLNLQTLLLQAEKIVGRDFSSSEWVRFFHDAPFIATFDQANMIVTIELP